MQRLFSMFPDGGPGVALVMLRLSAAAMLGLCLQPAANTLPGWIAFVAGLLIIGLCLGIFTPLLAMLCIVTGALTVLGEAPARPLICFLLVLDAVMVGLLGPGAYSVDARLFGRRVIRLPPRRR